LAELDVVTGGFSYTGRWITEALLERGRRVRTLTRKEAPEDPLAAQVERALLRFDDTIVESLRGADTLYNTYWVRFERGRTTFAGAVENSGALFRAAARAGVRRVVQISVANPSEQSPWPYFRGKAEVERLLQGSGLSWAVVRPTVVFGPGDILINNIAWILRRCPLFLVPGDGRYELQPVSVRDTARLAVDAGFRDDPVVLDAAGPERFPFEDLVQLLAQAVGSRSRIRRAPPEVALALTRPAGLFLRDVVLTRDELESLMAGLLVSHEPPLGTDRLTDWAEGNGALLGRAYASELARNFRGTV
jgi:NADH dehydrogenase